MVCRLINSVLTPVVLSVILSATVEAFGADPFSSEVEPVLKALCYECHGSKKQKGELRLDTLARDFTQSETWHDALEQLNRGEMPPRKAAQPSEAERELLTSSLNAFLRKAAEAKRAAGGRIHSRRLTRYEYANTMKDLLGIDLDFAKELPPEPASPDGFLNNGGTLEMSPSQVETYLKTARRALDIVIKDDSIPTPEVIHVNQSSSALGYLPKRKDGGHTPVQPEYILDIPTFPREGKFEVKITAKLANPDQAGFPRMRISMGHVPGIIHVPRKTIGEVEVSSTEPVTFSFTGRMEDFPQMGPIPFGRSGFKGQIVMVDFMDADGNQLRYPDQQYAEKPEPPKKGKKAPPAKPKPPAFGSRLELAIEAAEFTGPIPDLHLLKGTDPESEIATFTERAFRRPVSPEEVQPYLDLFQSLRKDQGLKKVSAIRETFAAILVSPHFLYRVEESNGEQLTDYELASQLSYLLWASMPDELLLEQAKAGTLHKPKHLEEQIDRMLRNPRSKEFVTRFADQWLGLDALDRVAVDPNTFPDFNEKLKTDFRNEVHAVLSEILSNDITMLELLDSDWSMLNHNLANHYGVQDHGSDSFKRIVFGEGSPRGGLLGHGAFHLTGSNGDQSHPIKRAVWVLDRLLDAPPASPPPDTPELDSDNPDFSKLSLKEKLKAHRNKESCNNCHKGIDPWGLALENFDPLGQWRESKSTTTTLPDGTTISGLNGLKQFLLEHRKSWFARSVVRRLMTFAYGRSLDIGDHETVENLTRTFEVGGYRLRPLIVEMVSGRLDAKE